MPFVFMFVYAARIVKEGKQFHYVTVGSGLVCQHQAVGPNACPVRHTMVAPPVNLKLLAQVLQKSMAVEDKHNKLKY